MGKKGQIYIIAAIILSAVIFAIVSVTNLARQEQFRGDFEKLSQNYEREGSRIINLAVKERTDATGRFGNFTYLFTSYSKTQNPKFGLVYVLDHQGKVTIGNYLKESVAIDTGTEPKLEIPGCFENVEASVAFGKLSVNFGVNDPSIGACIQTVDEPASKKLYVEIENQWYPFELVADKPQLMIVSRMQQEEQKKVFVGGEGFVKEEDHCKDLSSNRCGEFKSCEGNYQNLNSPAGSQTLEHSCTKKSDNIAEKLKGDTDEKNTKKE